MLCAVLGRNQFAILRIGASFDSKMNGGKTVKRISARELAVMAICLTLGLLAKRIISPLTNTLTDFFRIPGGSAAVGFSLAFLVVGKHMSHVPCAATMMGFVQSLLALALGMSGYQGMLAVFSYTFPGIVIDVTAYFIKQRGTLYCFVSCILGSVVSALISNMIAFHLKGISLVLWLLLSALSGALGGYIAGLVSTRLSKIIT